MYCIVLIDIIPHLKEHRRETVYTLSLHTDTGILPVSKPDFFVDIFICYIVTTGMRHTSVYYQYLPMVPVIHNYRKHGLIWIESSGLYSDALHLLYKMWRNGIYAAKIIIYDSHHNSMLYLFFEYIKYLIKHNATAYYEILHKDKLFS